MQGDEAACHEGPIGSTWEMVVYNPCRQGGELGVQLLRLRAVAKEPVAEIHGIRAAWTSCIRELGGNRSHGFSGDIQGY
jgi:hypothetical protein